MNGYPNTPKAPNMADKIPSAERWSSEEQLVLWRAAWADVANRHLEQHRTRRTHRPPQPCRAWNLMKQPTVHEGVVARAIGEKGHYLLTGAS